MEKGRAGAVSAMAVKPGSGTLVLTVHGFTPVSSGVRRIRKKYARLSCGRPHEVRNQQEVRPQKGEGHCAPVGCGTQDLPGGGPDDRSGSLGRAPGSRADRAAAGAATVWPRRWSLRPLAREAVEVGICESISHEIANQTLTNGIAGWQLQYRVILPKADGEYVAVMESPTSVTGSPFGPVHVGTRGLDPTASVLVAMTTPKSRQPRDATRHRTASIQPGTMPADLECPDGEIARKQMGSGG